MRCMLVWERYTNLLEGPYAIRFLKLIENRIRLENELRYAQPVDITEIVEYRVTIKF